MSKTIRQSNFELLRIVAIIMVITHHLVIKSAQTCGYTRPFSFDDDGVLGLVINSLVVGGVNIFILISGWFGIKKIGSQIIRLIIDCFIYCMITNLFCIFVLGYPFSISELLYSCNFMNNWFVFAFILFLLLSPIVERAMINIDSKTLGYFILLLTIVNVVFGFGVGMYKHNGYNAYNFMYVYMTGRYLRLNSQNRIYQILSRYGFIIWILCSIPLTGGYIFAFKVLGWSDGLSINYFGYNNPLIIISSIAFFLPFSNMRLQSNLVNIMAKGVFGIFLLHTTTLFIHYRVEIIGGWYQQYGYSSIFISALFLFVICNIITIIVEKMKSPIIQYINSKIKF